VQGPAGALAVVQFAPPQGTPVRFGVLHLPAFGDEMNKARHVVAAQARAFAALGGVTHVLDPRGTGDSAGEFADATWDGWREDAKVAWGELRAGLPRGLRCALWGLRVGALLAADLACRREVDADALLLWQPVTGGRAFFNQFLRIAAAQALEERGGVTTRDELRAALAAGRAVEVGGYALNSALVEGAEALELATLPVQRRPVVVREAGASEAASLAPGTQRWVAQWRTRGVEVDAAAVAAPSFWASLELEDAPALIAGTTSALARACATP
jgi:exosortase A-associated hydrolase 2